MATELNVALQIDARANIDALQKTIDELKAAGSNTEDLERQLQALTAELNRLGQEAQANGLESVSEDAQKLRDQLNATSAEAEKLRKITEAKITLGLAGDEEVKKRIEKVAAAYQLLQEQGDLTQEELTRAAELYSEQLADLERQLGSVSHELSALEGARVTIGLDADNRARQEITQLDHALEQLRASGTLTEEELARATQLHAERVGELREQLGEVGETAEESAERFSDMAQGLAEVVAAGGGLAGVVAEAVQFEAAMASVKKAVDATPEAMAHLSSQVKELAIELGMVPEAVAEITAAGGRLGVAFEDLPEFTRLAGQMAVAFDMTAEAAGDSAAKLANVFQIPLSEVRALGDAINTLGNNTAAREGEIVEALTRIGGSARQFGLATEQTAALTASFIALGKSPETAATAINSLLNRLQTGGQGVSGFAEGLDDLGLSANRLADNIRANPQAALREFLGSLEKLDNQQRAITLTKLFGAEYADDISLMVGALAEYDRQLGLVGDKTRTAGAMQSEFAAQMDTTEKKLEQAQIAIGNLAKELGSQLLPVVASGAQGFAGMAGSVLEFAATHPQITRFVTLLAAAKAASVAYSGALRVLGVEGTTATGALTAGYTRVTTALAAYRAQIAAASAASAGMSVAMRAQAVAAAATGTALRGAVGAMSALVRANPLATVITAGAAAFALMSGKVDETTARIRDMEQAVKDADKQYRELKTAAAGGIPLDVGKAEQSLAAVSDAADKSRDALLQIQQQGKGAWGDLGESVKDVLPLVDSQSEKLAKVTAELERQTARERELKDAIAKRRAEIESDKAIEELNKQNKAAQDAANQIGAAVRTTLDSLAKLSQGAARLTREQVDAVGESLKTLTSPAAFSEAETYIHQLRDQFKITHEEEASLLAGVAKQAQELGIITTQAADGTQSAVKRTRDEVAALADAYKALGADVPAAYRQMSGGEKEVTDALKKITTQTQVSATEMQGLLQNAFAKIDTSEGVAAVQQIYQEWRKTAKLTEDKALAMNQTIAQGVAGVGTGLNAALKTLNLSAQEYASGISDKAGKAIEAFAVVAKDAGEDTDKLARAWAAMSGAANSSAQEVRAAEAALRQSVGGDAAKADAIKKIADAYKDTGDAAAKALAALNISSADLARGLSTGVSEMLANWQTGMASLKTNGELTAQAVQTAFTSSLSKLSSAADFKALHDEMQRTGTLSRLTAEQMQILRAGMQGGAEAANAMRSALEQHGQATQALADASGKVKEAKEAETQAVRDNAVAHKDASEAEAAGAEKSAEATEKKKKAMMTIYDASKLNAEAIGLVDDAINSMVTSMGHMDADDYLRKVEAMSRVGQQYVADVQRAEEATERLNQRTSDGTVSMHDIAEATHAASSNIAALDSTTLRNLNASIDAARKKLEDLQQQAKDTAADLDAELAQLKGDDTKTAKLEQQRKLRELEGKLQEARIRGNAEEIAQYERALELQRQIGAEKARQAADKKAEAAARAQESRSRGNATPRSTTASSATSHGAGDISPQQVVDVWDDRIAAAERRGAQNFANELYNAAKRSPR
jgi:TP901 family phage tail tape measure protein